MAGHDLHFISDHPVNFFNIKGSTKPKKVDSKQECAHILKQKY
jgi:hypothetical protein